MLGLDVGSNEDGVFWTSFLRSLVARGLSGVRVVTSDSHRALKSAVEAVLQGASWQRCRVHFIRNALSLISKTAQQMVGRPYAHSPLNQTPKAPASRSGWLHYAIA